MRLTLGGSRAGASSASAIGLVALLRAQLDIVAAVGEADHCGGAVVEMVDEAELSCLLCGAEVPDFFLPGCPAALFIQKKPAPQMLDENFHVSP